MDEQQRQATEDLARAAQEIAEVIRPMMESAGIYSVSIHRYATTIQGHGRLPHGVVPSRSHIAEGLSFRAWDVLSGVEEVRSEPHVQQATEPQPVNVASALAEASR